MFRFKNVYVLIIAVFSLVELSRPRLTSEGGNLVFFTGPTQNIEFRTGSQGKIRVNDEDLSECLHQVLHEKDPEVILYVYKL